MGSTDKAAMSEAAPNKKELQVDKPAPSKQEVESAIIQQFQKLKNEKNELSSKMAEIKMHDEKEEEILQFMKKYNIVVKGQVAPDQNVNAAAPPGAAAEDAPKA